MRLTWEERKQSTRWTINIICMYDDDEASKIIVISDTVKTEMALVVHEFQRHLSLIQRFHWGFVQY